MTNHLLAPRPQAHVRRPVPVLACQTAIIVNASKFPTSRALHAFEAGVEEYFVALGWSRPFWLDTTPASRGAKEARWAERAGFDVVLVAGGDRTIRTVAQELAGTTSIEARVAINNWVRRRSAAFL